MRTKKASKQKRTNPNGSRQRMQDQSHYDLFRGRFTFSDEPDWLRLVLGILVLAALLAVIYLLHNAAWPVLGASWLRRFPGVRSLLNWRNRSP